jgi:hypothetical protein
MARAPLLFFQQISVALLGTDQHVPIVSINIFGMDAVF